MRKVVDQRSEMIREGVASLPPATVAVVTTIGGVSLQDWVLLATLGWIGLQASYFMWQRWKEWGPKWEKKH